MGRVLGFDYITSLHHLIFVINLVQIRKKTDIRQKMLLLLYNKNNYEKDPHQNLYNNYLPNNVFRLDVISFEYINVTSQSRSVKHKRGVYLDIK